MASAVLSNRNEPNWSQHRTSGGGFMGKVPFSNSNPNPNPNSNSKPKLPNKRTQSVSEDGSSLNRRMNDGNHSQFVTFKVASYTKNELKELKIRLLSELEQIRNLRNRFESGEFQFQPPMKKSTSKKISGNKRPFPVNPVNRTKDLKRSNPEVDELMQGCAIILQKLMRGKSCIPFNVPVDPVLMNIHDYFDIIKQPMDLGTVKSKLLKKVYSSPEEFASDVRLTFNNALTYNPKGHYVNIAAEQLSEKFEKLYHPLHDKYEELSKHDRDFEELQGSSWNHVEPERERVIKKKENPNLPAKFQQPEPPQPLAPPVPPASSSKPPTEPLLLQSPVRTPSPMRALPVKPLKLPKPKARDPNKRDMNLEEKQKLGAGLQSLPPEKMEQVVQIIRKRNGHLEQDGDEIELDIEAVDTETLWELDRLVTNWKKMMSKIKRQALMDNVNNNNNNVVSNNDNGEVPSNEKIDDEVVQLVETKKQKKVETGDEDVDIGDDIPMNVFPPVEIEKDKDVVGGHASSGSSSSSSSGSDSSSSSGSDSGSSSGSDSEAENGHQ